VAMVMPLLSALARRLSLGFHSLSKDVASISRAVAHL
jgi:hypothetical protein